MLFADVRHEGVGVGDGVVADLKQLQLRVDGAALFSEGGGACRPLDSVWHVPAARLELCALGLCLDG